MNIQTLAKNSPFQVNKPIKHGMLYDKQGNGQGIVSVELIPEGLRVNGTIQTSFKITTEGNVEFPLSGAEIIF